MKKIIIEGKLYINQWGDLRIPFRAVGHRSSVEYIEKRKDEEWVYNPYMSAVTKASFFEKFKEVKDSEVLSSEQIVSLCKMSNTATKNFVDLMIKAQIEIVQIMEKKQ